MADLKSEGQRPTSPRIKGPTKFVHEQYEPPSRKFVQEQTFAYVKHRMSSSVVFELVHRNELNALCNPCTAVLYLLNYGVLFGLFGYGLFVALTAEEGKPCEKIAEWLTVWCSFAMALGGCCMLLYGMRYILSATWQYPTSMLGPGKNQIAFVTSRKSLECTVVEPLWVENLRTAKMSRLLPYFVLCGVLIWQPAGLAFSAYWLTDAQTELSITKTSRDCGHLGDMALAIWAFSVLVVCIAIFIYVSICIIILSIIIQQGFSGMVEAVEEVLSGPLESFHDGVTEE